MSDENDLNEIENNKNEVENKKDETPKKSFFSVISGILALFICGGIVYALFYRNSSDNPHATLRFQNFFQFIIFFAVIVFINYFIDNIKRKSKNKE